MNIVCLIFEELTLLDAVGPCEVLAQLPGAKITFVAPEAAALRADRSVALIPDATLDDVHTADLLLVPGGFGARRLQHDERVLAWLRALDQTTRITASVCTGALLLAAAGLLRDRRATTHWAFFEPLQAFGARPVHERVVRDGKYATAAGVSAGIDLALTLAMELQGREVAEAIQLSIEYDPAPPLAAGSPSSAGPGLRDRVFQRIQARGAQRTGA